MWGWSPQRISQRIKLDFPDDESMRISHEAIYQALYVQGRGALQRELVYCLRTGRALRVPRARSRRKAWAHVTPEVLISELDRELATNRQGIAAARSGHRLLARLHLAEAIDANPTSDAHCTGTERC